MTCPHDPTGCIHDYVDTLARTVDDLNKVFREHKDFALERIAFLEEGRRVPMVDKVTFDALKPVYCPRNCDVDHIHTHWAIDAPYAPPPPVPVSDTLARVCEERDALLEKLKLARHWVHKWSSDEAHDDTADYYMSKVETALSP